MLNPQHMDMKYTRSVKLEKTDHYLRPQKIHERYEKTRKAILIRLKYLKIHTTYSKVKSLGLFDAMIMTCKFRQVF